MNAKRKPTKPVKAWAYVRKDDGEIVAWSNYSRAHLRSKMLAIKHEFGGDWRIARVEIREVGR